jgi:hypothetical protein
MIMLLCVISCEKKAPSENTGEPLAYKIKRDRERKVNEFAARYRAKTDWQKSITDPNNEALKTYTIDVQQALILPKQQPIAFSGNIEDISSNGETSIIRFYNEFAKLSRGLLGADVRLDLECNQQQLKEIQKHRKEKRKSILYDHFVVIAKISDVKKVRFTIDASSSLYDENAEIEIENPNIFIAKGKCVAVKCLLCE